MGELRHIRRRPQSQVNPGFRAHVAEERISESGVVLHLCPRCKVALGESDATVFIRRCHNCGIWVRLEKC